jgi:ParB/RepB/Spo0J family partition protein
MASLKEMGKRSEYYQIDPRKLEIKSDWNSRDFSDPANIAHVEELAKSIAENGVREPLKVYLEKDVPYITNGECRYRAVMLLIERGVDIKAVPVIAEDRLSNEADRLFTQFISNSGKPFGPIENARLFKRLLDMGWQQQGIAKKTGFSGGRVSQLLELLRLPQVLQKFIIEGKASASMVLSVWKKHNEDTALAVAELSGAVAVAAEQGRKRAMPKDTGDGEGGEGGSGKSSGPKNSLKKHLKALVEKAYAEERIDDTESMVTMSLSEGDWAELMEMIDY